jgi:hypothetical protein
MTIDLERLAVDAEYWNEVAPDGATHFMYSEKFVKWVDGVEWRFYVSSDKAWKKSMCSWSLQRYTDNGNEVIAKPTKPAAQEWDGERLPPVGTECEAVYFNSWAHVKIVAHVRVIDGLQAVHQLVGYNEWNAYGEPSKFRPIRSHAWRECEELGRDIIDDLDALGINLSAKKVEIFARSIIDKGYSKSKQS